MSWSRDAGRRSVTYILQVLGLLGIKWLRHLDCVVIDSTLEKNSSEKRKYRGNMVKVGSACCAPRIFFSAGGEEYCRPKSVSAHGTSLVCTGTSK
jgi:hypothetical protein